jgi:isoleucyl-tRNA synthetase
MAEDVWLNIPYKTNHLSVFQSEWPEVENFNITPDEIKVAEFIKDTLRPMVNRLLEHVRTNNKIGSSLETQVFLQCPQNHQLMNLVNMHLSPQELSKFLLVSKVSLNAPMDNQTILSNSNENGLDVSLSLATGSKCDRCWHYEATLEDYILGNNTNKICQRCLTQVAR